MTNDRPDTQQQTVEEPRRWFGPLILLVVILTPIVILIVSNTDTATLAWANYEWSAPQWLVLSATFVAGLVGGKVLGWLWRSWRRRRRRMAGERDVLRKHSVEGD
ncbi:MAG: hypothetical protein WD184_07695 [Acidimicrobiia bacterium]